jgi:diguanylate cyclase (GGDEF)-like protein
MSRSVSARRFRSPVVLVTVQAARSFCRSTHNQRAALRLRSRNVVLGLRRHGDGTAHRHLRCTYPVVKSSRSAQYALMTAVAAVVGLLLLRAPFTAVPLTADFFSNRYTFSYLFAAVALTFLGLGYVLGRQSDRLRRLSTIDGLTGLSNRRGFDDRLQKEWRRAERYGSSLALLMIDIDGLKEVNDVRGHAAGDSVLSTTAIAIRKSLRSSDLGARWGGDEFAIIAPETSREAAELLGRRLLVRLKRSSGLIRWSRRPLVLQCSSRRSRQAEVQNG